MQKRTSDSVVTIVFSMDCDTHDSEQAGAGRVLQLLHAFETAPKLA